MKDIIASLKAERDHIDTAIRALESLSSKHSPRERSRTKAGFVKRRRSMSPAARARIVAAQRKRWAAWRKANKKTA